MIHRTILTLGALLLGAGAGAAQEPSILDAGATRITLDDALARAVVRSPQLAQSEQALVNAGETRRTAVGAFLPTISTNSGMSVRSTQRFDAATDRLVTGSSNSYNAGLTARYDLFRGGQRFSELDRAAADLTAARARREDQRFNVNFQTKNFFFQALRQEELLTVALRRIEQATQSLEMTRTQQQVGAGTVSDTLRARLEFINSRQAVLNAQVQTRAARFALGRQVGIAEPVIPVAPVDLEPRPLRLSEREILEVAENLAPSVQAAVATFAAAREAYSSSKSAYIPSLSLSSGYNWSNQEASFSGGSTSWNLNFNLSYPIFNGFSREASIVRAEYSTRVARLQEDDARLASRQETDAALRTLETSELAIDIAGEAVAVADEDLRVTRERYRLSVAIILDVVTSQIASDQARVDLVNARYDYVLARAELEAILGRDL
ncbi:MAG: TolC family protein [Gemmatimonadetes bacterium]|nr:TolC family protein [Gemmatimonadota bacterium]MCH8810405.1 TolC family protein [Gemmatimonadota bacterium]